MKKKQPNQVAFSLYKRYNYTKVGDKMKKQGFTLVEMLAVLVVIVLLTTILVPTMINLITKNKNKLSNKTESIIFAATEVYLSENSNYTKKEGNMYCITLGDLVNDGKINNPINDFNTGKEVPLDKTVRVKVNKYFEYEYKIVNKNECESKYGYTEELLNGADPIILDNMIPVLYDDATDTWVKANPDQKWYEYSTRKWANAVTVSNESREKYTLAPFNTTISNDDINGFYVWIPRYEYKKFTSNGEKKIQINFISQSKLNASKDYYIPIAFSYDLNSLRGFWISKYEASSDDSKTLCTQKQTQEVCNVNTNNPIFKQSLVSWRNISLSNAYSSIRLMEQENNIYGFISKDVDTHLVKNTEWAAVAYLAMSDYGKYGDTNYIGLEKEVKANNCNEYITGSYCENGVTNSYSTQNAMHTSTTGTVYGVYDMAGSSDEFVMANLGNKIASSEFNQMPNDIYYNLFSSTQCSEKTCMSNAINETRGWYGDISTFITDDNPWLLRGGNNTDGTSAGIFAYKNSNGAPNQSVSFRAVIISN